MEYELKNGKIVKTREVKITDTLKILNYMEIVNSETKNLSREPHEWNMTFEEEEKFLKRVIASEHEYMLTAWDEDKLIGLCGFHGSSLERLRHRSDLGISILKEYHGLGLGFFLMEELIEAAKKLNKKYLELTVRCDNPQAIHIYKKAGFIREGVKKEAFFVDGKYIDLLLMARKL